MNEHYCVLVRNTSKFQIAIRTHLRQWGLGATLVIMRGAVFTQIAFGPCRLEVIRFRHPQPGR